MNSQKKSVLIVEIGGERFMFPVEQVRAVMQQPELSRAPKMPRFVRGMAHVRGEIVPVVDLPARFALSEGVSSDKRQIALLELGAMTMGVLIDSVVSVAEIEASEIDTSEQAIGVCLVSAVSGAIIIHERIHFMIDPDLLFEESEIKRASRALDSAQETAAA